MGIYHVTVSQFTAFIKDARRQTVSIMAFRSGKVIHEAQYFAEPFEAPAWRSQWVETGK